MANGLYSVTVAEIARNVGYDLTCQRCRVRFNTGKDAGQHEPTCMTTRWPVEPCSVCGGNGKPVSGLPCICGGSGRETDRTFNLHAALVKTQRELAMLKTQVRDAVFLLNGMINA